MRSTGSLPTRVLFLALLYCILRCICMFFWIGQMLFEAVIKIVRTLYVKKDVYTATVCSYTAAGLQDCARFANRSLSIDTSLLAGDKEALRVWHARLLIFQSVVFVFCLVKLSLKHVILSQDTQF